MEEERQMAISSGPQGQRPGRFLGSLKDALVAASRDDTGQVQQRVAQAAEEAAAGREA